MTSKNRTEIVLATRSEGKVRELVEMVAEAGFAPVTLDAIGVREVANEETIEAFDTFEENALAKARWFSAHCAGRVVLADDSGLCVDALGGRPGVRSKRWAYAPGIASQDLDAANNARLVRELAPHAVRAARYVCIAALSWPGGELHERGECAGVITAEPSGAGGFGYDPYFVCDELRATFADASANDKARVSHRGRAVRAALRAFARAAPGMHK
ncbi:MAG: non-canonical purine NTP pyrophosphatase [Gemmatimonadetes bacterium]|nr:non-canonical purine NTP pyrophosphatase [Gemmatimonadota bacterium]